MSLRRRCMDRYEIFNTKQFEVKDGVLFPIAREVEDYSDIYSISEKNVGYYAHWYETWLNGTPSFPNLTTVSGSSAMCYMFQNCTGLTGTPSFPNLTTVSGSSAMYYMFQNCTGLTGTPSFPNLTTVSGSSAMLAMFANCTSLTGAPSFPNLTTVSGGSAFFRAFRDCANLTGDILYPKLEIVNAKDAMYEKYAYDSLLKGASFPKLTTFTAASMKYMFYCCTGMTYVHFRADLDDTHKGYLTKTNLFGGETSTYCHPDLQILFDLTDD